MQAQQEKREKETDCVFLFFFCLPGLSLSDLSLYLGPRRRKGGGLEDGSY